MRMTFQATLEALGTSPPWTAIRIPFDPTETWPNRTKLRVQGSIRSAHSGSDLAAFSTSLFGSRKRGYFLLVTGKMRKAAHLSAGSLAEVVLEPVLDETAATPPPELARLLKADRSVKKWHEQLNYSMRKYIADSIKEPKSGEARKRRAEQWMERMMLTLEGEEFPPPVLQIAFQRQPMARAGWEAMTANRRRMILLSIFSCQSPEAQAKRVEHALIEAMQAAKRAGRPGKAPEAD